MNIMEKNNNVDKAAANGPAQIAMQWIKSCQGELDATIVQTPVGNFALYARGDVLVKAEWVLDNVALQHPKSNFLKGILQQVNNYWQTRYPFPGLAVFDQGTDFRRRVWQALCAIPYGETITYLTLAKRLGSSPRAIGGACRHNPYPLIIPCHRVVSTNGIGGYAGQVDGDLLDIKRGLLEHELSYMQ